LVYGATLILIRFFRKEDWELFKASINFRKKLEPDIPPTTHL
jgi:hypothetical protein